MANNKDKQKRLEELRQELSQLEREVAAEPTTWQPSQTDYYGLYHATTGMALGVAGAIASLLFNVVGSLVVKQHPLRLIQVYLTFPLGEQALSDEFDTGIAMAVGCCLYIGTGMLLGVPFQMAMARLLPNGSLPARLVFGTVLGLAMWAINFYGILSWLQPLVCDGGNWISDPALMPPWIGAATHLVFGWTMAYLYPWGKYTPYQRQTRIAPSV